MSSMRGMPLLSGPLPEPVAHDERSEMSCRKCNKEFNVLFTRGRRCNHCSYIYCNSCSDYQALMPRTGLDSGYDRVSVCAFCIQYLQITAGGKGYLRTLSLAKLKNYMQSYGIRLGPDVLEKEDVIDAIINARTYNGCLPIQNENYYRKHAVPSGQTSRPRGLFSRSERNPIPSQSFDQRTDWREQREFARPDLDELGNEERSSPRFGSYPGTEYSSTGRTRTSASSNSQGTGTQSGNVNASASSQSQSQFRPQAAGNERTQSTNSSGAQQQQRPESYAQPQPQTQRSSQYAPPPGPPPFFNQQNRSNPYIPPQFQERPHQQAQFGQPNHPPPPPFHAGFQPPPHAHSFHYHHSHSPPFSPPPPPPPPGFAHTPHYAQSPPPPPRPQSSPRPQRTPHPQLAQPPRPSPPPQASTPPGSTTTRTSDTSPSRPPASSSSSQSHKDQAIPTLEELLQIDECTLPTFSVSTLKAILFQNHVSMSGPVLEKQELVDRVKRLLDDERRERVHAEAQREREEWERAEREWEERERAKREAEQREAKEREEKERQAQQRREAFRPTVEDANESGGSDEGGHQGSQPQGDAVMDDLVREERAAFSSPELGGDEEARPRVSEILSDFTDINVDDEYGQGLRPKSQSEPAASTPSPPPPSRPPPERNGLCVVCQDAESNIVIVDCGHLALCRACADLIWSSSRECPLCRTRIVTEARLLRVFKS